MWYGAESRHSIDPVDSLMDTSVLLLLVDVLYHAGFRKLSISSDIF